MRLKSHATIALSLLCASALLVACGDDDDGGGGGGSPLLAATTRFASLDSAQETTGSTSTGKGAGLLSLDPSSRRIAGFVVSTGVPGTVAHIHLGARGVAGGILVPLEGGPEVFTVPDDATLPEANVADFEAGRLYYNIHSEAFPDGEIRGQLDMTPTATLLASLDGKQETPPNESTATGGGILAFDSASGRLAGFVVSSGIQATVAHVHAAPRGTAGGILVPLVGGPGAFFVPDGASLPADNTADFGAGNLYYNLHSTAFPEGEIRGQLDLAPTSTHLASLNGAQETPPNSSAAKGAGLLGMDEATRRVAGFTVSTGLSGDAAHVHVAPRGTAGPIIVPLAGGPNTWSVADGATLPEENIVIGELARVGEKRLTYWYDFGDGWWHTIEIEAIGPAQKDVFYPRCTGGANACPPEDCGGLPGFEEFKEAIADPKHPSHADLKEWYGDGDYDPGAFSAEETSKLLRQVVTGELPGPDDWPE